MLDSSVLKHLTADEAAKARAFEQMFASDGWKALMEITQQQYKIAEQGVMQSKSWPENRVAFGRLTAFGDLLLFEEQVEKQFETQVEQRRAEAEQEEMDAELEYE